MALKILFIINTALCLFRGTGFTFAPTNLWKPFNVNLDHGTAFPVQLLGAAYFATAFMNMSAINFIEKSEVQSVLIFNVTIEIIGTILTLRGISSNRIGKLGWTPFAVHLFLALSFGYFLLY